MLRLVVLVVVAVLVVGLRKRRKGGSIGDSVVGGMVVIVQLRNASCDGAALKLRHCGNDGINSTEVGRQ